MSVYYSRGLETVLYKQGNLPVTILEGRRAVGKTTLLRHLGEQSEHSPAVFSFAADGNVLRQVKQDPVEWFSRLPTFSIIDEAQLLPGITQYIKAVVDRVGDNHRFILCGSAGIGRSRAGQADWLAGRARRLELLPFSAGELSTHRYHRAASLVDAFFFEDWSTIDNSQVFNRDEDALISTLRFGGMPLLRLAGPKATFVGLSQVNAQISAEIEMTLGRQLLPGQDIDYLRAKAVLDAVLSYPGGLLNKNRLANELGMDVRTVGRYLDILTERFLIYRLPNFKGSVASIGRGMPKLHAVDTSTTCELLSRRGHDISSDSAKAGQVLESWVANQIRAELGWAKNECEIGYWRDKSGTRDYEVDIVLIDQKSRMVGIEVKYSSHVTPADFKGINQLRADCEKNGRTFHRGFLVCCCTQVQQLANDLWAVPYQMLGEYPTAFQTEQMINPKEKEIVMVRPSDKSSQAESPAATVFVSYAHSDNDTVYGALIDLVHKVEDHYELVTGEKLQVFIDKEMKWGELWEHAIDTGLESTAFLLAFVSPRYLKSDACRKEVETFSQAAEKAKYKAILPVLIQEIPSSLDSDPVWNTVCGYQYEKISVAQLRSGSKDILDEIAEKLALRLYEVIEERLLSASKQLLTSDDNESLLDDEELPTLEEVLHDIDELTNVWNAEMDDFAETLTNLGNQLPKSFEKISHGHFNQRSIAGEARVLNLLAQNLDNSTKKVEQGWEEIHRRIKAVIEIAQKINAVGDKEETSDFMQGFQISLEQMRAQTLVPGMDLLMAQIPLLGTISHTLRPTEQSIMRAMRLFQSIHNRICALHDSISDEQLS